MSPSDNGSDACAFGVLTAGDQDSCQVTVPRPLTLGCIWQWERGSKSGKGEQSLGGAGQGLDRKWVCCPASRNMTGHFIHSLCIHLCCFFAYMSMPMFLCLFAFYFHCVCFSFFLENALRRGEFNHFRRFSIICRILAYTACLLSISFTIPCLSLPVGKSETIGSISPFFSVSCVNPLKDLFFKAINCFCTLLRAVMASESPGGYG